MLLTEWREQTTGIHGRDGSPCLSEILRFVFGERYIVQMRDGRSYEDKLLEPVLEIMRDEFKVWNTTITLRNGSATEMFCPMVEILQVGKSTISDPLGQRGSVSLVVSVVKPAPGPLPSPDIEAVIAQVRESVTMFSLTGNWDVIKKENL